MCIKYILNSIFAIFVDLVQLMLTQPFLQWATIRASRWIAVSGGWVTPWPACPWARGWGSRWDCRPHSVTPGSTTSTTWPCLWRTATTCHRWYRRNRTLQAYLFSTPALWEPQWYHKMNVSDDTKPASVMTLSYFMFVLSNGMLQMISQKWSAPVIFVFNSSDFGSLLTSVSSCQICNIHHVWQMISQK